MAYLAPNTAIDMILSLKELNLSDDFVVTSTMSFSKSHIEGVTTLSPELIINTAYNHPRGLTALDNYNVVAHRRGVKRMHLNDHLKQEKFGLFSVKGILISQIPDDLDLFGLLSKANLSESKSPVTTACYFILQSEIFAAVLTTDR